MGYELARFVSSKVDEEFICAICMCVLENPLETPCEHHFCRACILEWLRRRHRCPLDQTIIGPDHLCQPSRLLTNQLGRLEIHCDFRDQGCLQTVPLEHLAAHRLKCPSNPRPGVVPEPQARPLRSRQGRPAGVEYGADDEADSDISMGAAVGLVALAGVIGTVVAGVMGYKKGRSDH